MVIKDINLLRALFTLKSLYRQVDIAEKIHASENSVTRWFKGKPMHRSMAERIAEFLERDTDDLFLPKKSEAAK